MSGAENTPAQSDLARVRTSVLLAVLGLLALPLPALAGLRPAYGGELHVLLSSPPRVSDPALATEPADLVLVRAVHDTPLELDERGRLSPGLLEEVPSPEAGGRAFRLRLRAGLRFADGTPLLAQDLAASLSRLLAGEAPNAWLALPTSSAPTPCPPRTPPPSPACRCSRTASSW